MDNKAREVNNPIIKQVLDETTPEELAKIDTEMSKKFSIEIIEPPMTKNTEQKSAFWLMLDQDIDDHNSIVDDRTLIEQFLIECGKYADTANIPDELIETYIRREKRKIEESKEKRK